MEVGRFVIIKKLSRKTTKILALVITLVLIASAIIFFKVVPIKKYFEVNTAFYYWKGRDYEQIKDFNRIDFPMNGLPYRQFGEDVPKNPETFSKNFIKYLPNTNRWLVNAFGEKNSAVCLGMVDRNRVYSFTDKNGEFFIRNYVITTMDGTPIDYSDHGFLYAEINGILVDSQLRFRVCWPDFSSYDEVIIDVNFD